MISVFDTNPVVFESTDRILTVSYNGVLCKDSNGQVITDIDFDDVNELHLTRYLNSNSNYSIIFRDHNWKNIEGQDLDTDRTDYNTGHNIRETKAIIAAFARHKLTADFPANLDTLQLPLDYSYMGKREITIKNGVISNGKVDIPINEIEKPSSFFKKIFDKCDMKITLNAITLPLLEAIVTRNTGHGIDFTRGNGFDQKDSNYIIIRYLDSGFFLEKDGTATTEWQKTAAETTAKFNYDVKTLLV
ncbi:hypothetical protein [Veillonella parvula]|uniref:hypothetical protein n=1 Tax=Veillonella parvula TaxID=29466 RepID=UPI002901C089|nr:hypothetical protein [Veillonella parvula]MDU3191399.1 hypothetical protein [Veillonella parvula]